MYLGYGYIDITGFSLFSIDVLRACCLHQNGHLIVYGAGAANQNVYCSHHLEFTPFNNEIKAEKK